MKIPLWGRGSPGSKAERPFVDRSESWVRVENVTIRKTRPLVVAEVFIVGSRRPWSRVEVFTVVRETPV